MKVLYLVDKKDHVDDFIVNGIESIGTLYTYDNKNNIEKLLEGDISYYDLIVIRGFYDVLNYNTLTSHKNVVVVPDICDVGDLNIINCFKEHTNIKCLCFSSNIYTIFSKYNKNCFYIQYYPDFAKEASVVNNKEIQVIVEDVNSTSIPQVSYLLKNIPVSKYIINQFNLNEPMIETFSDLYDIESAYINIRDMKDTFLNTEKQNIIVLSSRNTLFNFDFLQMMNHGICVVAPNKEPFNEYISNGTTGYLYNPNNPFPLDLDEINNVRNYARGSVINGSKRWLENYNNLVEFFIVNEKKNNELYSMWNSKFVESQEIVNKHEFSKVSVVTVCKNAETEIEKTIKSVINQDYPNFEYVILDGDSTDETVNLIRKYATYIDYWHSKPDSGVYSTMIDSLEYLTGDWVIFMNAGDSFVSNDALTRMFKHVPHGVGVAFGHHIYTREDGIDEFHFAVDFDMTWYRLKNGYLDYDWLSGIPCHQSVATRVDVLKKYKFNENFKIAADHELYFRMRQDGIQFFNSNELISIYVGGGVSAKRFFTCIQEWETIAKSYGNTEAAEIFYKKFYSNLPPVHSKTQQLMFFTLKRWYANSKLLRKIYQLYKKYFQKKENIEYTANIEDGIMMYRNGNPSYVKDMRGFSVAEPWGRWTIKRKSIIKFKSNLPEKFELIIRGYAYGKNEGSPINIKIGKKFYSFIIQGYPSKEYKVLVDNKYRSNILEIQSPYVMSPYELYNKQSNDRRTLGIAISEIVISEK